MPEQEPEDQARMVTMGSPLDSRTAPTSGAMRPYYEDAACVIYHGDCRGIAPLLAVDHVITDPPYSQETHEGARGGAGDTKLVDFESITACELRVFYGALQASRWLIATMEYRHVLAMEVDPPPSWDFVRFGVWVKPNGAPQFTGDRPATGWEGVAILHKERRAKVRMRWNNGGHHAVWTFPKINGQHPTAKPDELFEAFIQQFTDPGDLILDPFMGSGTTLVAAKRLGRRAIGIEREEKYCEVAAQRLRQGALELFQSDPAVDPQGVSNTGKLVTRDMFPKDAA